MNLEDQIARKKDLEQQMLTIQQEIQDIQTKQKKPVLASIVDSMVEFEIDIQEVNTALRQRIGPMKSSGLVGRKLAPAAIKYRHPDTGDTWSGRGRAPRWLVEAENDGKSREDFLVEQ